MSYFNFVTLHTTRLKEEGMKTQTRLSVAVAVLLSAMTIACTTDAYDKGEGTYSTMLTDFTELAIDHQKQAVSFTTDEGQQYMLSNPFTGQWIETADTIYRTVVNFKLQDDGRAEVLQLGVIPTLIMHQPEDFKHPKFDPMGLESLWTAKNGKYVNMALLLKNGRDVDGNEGIHSLGLMCDEIRLNADNTRTACCRLLHDQGDAPLYYTNRRYVSILLPDEDRPDSLQLTIAAFDGTISKTVSIRP